MDDILRKFYYDPELGLISANKLHQKVKEHGITLKQTKDFIKKQETAQLYKPAVKQKIYFPITSYEPHQHIQLDILDLSNIATTNSYYKYLLVSIDIFTRKAFVVPMKYKNTDAVLEAVNAVVHFFNPKIITSDNGSEYTNKELNKFLKDHDIEHRFVDVNQHESLGVVDRYCRTLRGLINKYCTSHKTTRYIDVLDKLVQNYNNTFHSTIKCTPNEAADHVNEIKIIMAKKYMKAKEQEAAYNVGDSVRHLEKLSIFQKQGLSKWSSNIFTIVEKKPHSYKLSDGKWYRYYQLQPVKEVQETKKIGRPTKHTMQTLRKENTVKRKLRQEDIDVHNIIDKPRVRQKTDRFSY